MKVTPIKTERVTVGGGTIFQLLDKHLPGLPEKSVLVVTSKIVSICEGRTVPVEGTDKAKLVRREADYYMPAEKSRYGFEFTITRNTLIPVSGIDESNGNGQYILWPENPQKSANEIRHYLKNRFNLKNIGVIVTDSTCMPLRWGTMGIAIAHSGFKPLNDYIGKNDLFGRPYKVSRAGVASGLAAAAVTVMGEGAEQTPIAMIEDIPFIVFQKHDPTLADINQLLVAREDDLFGPFLESVKWEHGKNGKDKQ